MSEYEDRCVEFGRRLRELRQARGIPQERLAEIAGVDRTYISDAEAGKRNPTLKTIAKLATALGVPDAALISDDLPDTAQGQES